MGLQAGVRSVRGSMAVAAVGAMVATLLAVLGLAATPAFAADNITFRASAQAFFNQPIARVTIPASVRETDGMLLFVTSNKALANVIATPAGWTEEGRRLSSTDTETILYSKVAAANDAGRNVGVDFTATTKSSLILLAYDGTAADPVSAFASAAETVNRATHTTPVAHGGHRRLVRRLLLGGQVRIDHHRLDPSRGSDPAQPRGGHRRRADQLHRLRPQRAVGHRADHRVAPPPAPSRPPRRRCGPSCSRPTRRVNPNVAPVASFTVNCPQATCTVDASGLHRHRARHDRVLRLGLRRRHHRHRRDHDPHLRHQWRRRRSRWSSPTTRAWPSAPTTRTANPVVGGGSQPRARRTTGWSRTARGTTRPCISNGEIWDIEVIPQLNRVFIAGNFTSAANTIAPTTTVNQANLLSYNLQTGLIDTAVPPDVQRRRCTAVEASPDGTQAVRRRLVQHRERGGQAEGRQPQPHHRRAAEHLRLHQQHQQPGHSRWPRPTPRCTSAVASPGSTDSSAPAWPRSTPRPAPSTWRSTTSSPAASASTASSACPSSSSPTTRASCSSCTPAGRSTARTATAWASSTRPPRSCCPGAASCGTRTWAESVASPASTPLTSPPTTPTSSSAADRVATRRRSATPASPTR